MAVNDEAAVDVGVRLNEAGVVQMALVDLGVPPRFTVLTENLSRLVEQGVIAVLQLPESPVLARGCQKLLI